MRGCEDGQDPLVKELAHIAKADFWLCVVSAQRHWEESLCAGVAVLRCQIVAGCHKSLWIPSDVYDTVLNAKEESRLYKR